MKAKLNTIFYVAGDPTSGLLNPVDLNTAVAYVDRFNNPQSFERQVVVVHGKGKDRKVVPQVNDDGSPQLETVTEIVGAQGNGYDSYANEYGWVRNDYAYGLPPAALAKITVVNIDALHRYAASDNAETAQAATAALSAIREYDKVAAQKASERARKAAYETALALVIENGGSKDAFDAAWNAKNSVPAAPVEDDAEVVTA